MQDCTKTDHRLSNRLVKMKKQAMFRVRVCLEPFLIEYTRTSSQGGALYHIRRSSFQVWATDGLSYFYPIALEGDIFS